MSVTIRIPTQLRSLSANAAEVQVEASTVADALKALENTHPGFAERLFDETVKRAMAEGLVSRHVSADGASKIGPYRRIFPHKRFERSARGHEIRFALRRHVGHLSTSSVRC